MKNLTKLILCFFCLLAFNNGFAQDSKRKEMLSIHNERRVLHHDHRDHHENRERRREHLNKKSDRPHEKGEHRNKEERRERLRERLHRKDR